MYNIKEAAARSGVRVPTLRAWERRYGVVTPARTSAGYRLYDDAAIERLRRMRALLGAGWRPREAATEVLRGGPTGERAGSEAATTTDGGVTRPELGALVDRLVGAAAGFDSNELSAVLDEVLSRVSFEAAMEQVVFPALREIGRGWEAGRISVAAEHAFANSVERRLSILYEAAGRRPGDRVEVVIGLPAGARHELGALAFAVALRRLGPDTLYLGADVPLESFVKSLRQTSARLAVIGAITPADVDAARALVEAIRRQLPGVTCLVGGDAASSLADIARVLPGSLIEDAKLAYDLTR